jgi:bacillopeptidase F
MNKTALHLILAATVLLAATSAAAGTITTDLDAVLQTAGPEDRIPVIISLADRVNSGQFKGLPNAIRASQMIRTLRQKAADTQPAVIAAIGGEIAENIKQLWLVNAIAVTTDPATIRRLANHPAVASIRLDRVIPLADTAPVDPATAQWNASLIHADSLWAQGITGQGVVVANMDSGVDVQHPDLAERWRGGANSWYDPNGQHATPHDANGHGTQTMGLLVGGDQSGTPIGVAPGARWIAIKIFSDAGQASLSGIHLGFQWLLDPDGNPDSDDAPDVVNNSWGFNETAGQCWAEFATDIEVLEAAGIAMAFAAGNSGPNEDSSLSPANNPGAFAVGSVDSGYTVAYTSASGPNACTGEAYPEVMAPGVGVKTSDLTFGGAVQDSYAYVSGTSFAAPHVTGAMALLLSANPSLTPDQIEDALRQSALDLGAPGPDNDYGHGLIDVAAAHAAAGGTPPCGDGDGDGYSGTAGCGTPVDCNDADASIYPGAPEIADDGIDQDCDGQDKTSTACADADGDGYSSGPNCGAIVDCDDNDASIHPGATEIRSDGVDQDCNGYDLTIAIVQAVYNAKRDSLAIQATSELRASAALTAEIDGIGSRSMKWNSKKARWELSISRASRSGLNPAAPGEVAVSGVEGQLSAAIVKQ